MRVLKFVMACVLVTAAWGCGDDDDERGDAGDAGGGDARGDAGLDALRDAPVDAPVTDAPMPPVDGGGDVAGDTAADAVVPDAVVDVIADAPNVDPCALPSCLADLPSSCVGTGACVQQSISSATETTLTVCYANGVKERTVIGTSATMPITVSVSLNGAACYSVEAVTSAGERPETLLTFKDELGATIATGARDSISGAISITCVGQPAVFLPAGCPIGIGPGQGADAGVSTCVVGVCQ